MRSGSADGEAGARDRAHGACQGEQTGETERDGAADERPGFRWDLALLGALLGAATCGVAYWPANSALRESFGVQASPPGGGSYWMCWWLPVVVVIGVVGVLLFPRSSRPFACGLIVGLVAVAAVMCLIGYSVDSMPFSM